MKSRWEKIEYKKSQVAGSVHLNIQSLAVAYALQQCKHEDYWILLLDFLAIIHTLRKLDLS